MKNVTDFAPLRRPSAGGIREVFKSALSAVGLREPLGAAEEPPGMVGWTVLLVLSRLWFTSLSSMAGRRDRVSVNRDPSQDERAMGASGKALRSQLQSAGFDQPPSPSRAASRLAGSIEVITGCMFSGKTEEMIRRIKRAQIGRKKVVVFKPRRDHRYDLNHIVTSDGLKMPCTVVDEGDAYRLLELVLPDTDVVAIDEVNFFPPQIVDVCERLANRGVRVVAAGLDTNFRGEPFYPVPDLIALAEKVDKLQAVCVRCGEPATRTQRIVNGEPARYQEPVIVVGGLDKYEARCRRCHEVPR